MPEIRKKLHMEVKLRMYFFWHNESRLSFTFCRDYLSKKGEKKMRFYCIWSSKIGICFLINSRSSLTRVFIPTFFFLQFHNTCMACTNSWRKSFCSIKMCSKNCSYKLLFRNVQMKNSKIVYESKVFEIKLFEYAKCLNKISS